MDPDDTPIIDRMNAMLDAAETMPVRETAHYVDELLARVEAQRDAIRAVPTSPQRSRPGQGLTVAGNNTLAVNQSFASSRYDNVGQHAGHEPSEALTEIRLMLAKIDQAVGVRTHVDGEYARARGTIALLQEKIDLLETDLSRTKARNVDLAMQIRRIHDALDCPCEMDVLDSYDLVSHMAEMGITFLD